MAINNLPGDMDKELLVLCGNGKKLEAIKLYKDSTGLGLKQSKDYVEQLARAHGIDVSRGKHACFIATACYGDYAAPEVLVLRQYRDERLLPTKFGSLLVKIYYTISPPIARMLEKSASLRAFTRKYMLSIIVHKLQHKRKSKSG